MANQFQSRARLPQMLVNELVEDRLPILDAYLSPSIRVRESHQHAKPMIFFDPKHKLTGKFEQRYNTISRPKQAKVA